MWDLAEESKAVNKPGKEQKIHDKGDIVYCPDGEAEKHKWYIILGKVVEIGECYDGEEEEHFVETEEHELLVNIYKFK